MTMSEFVVDNLGVVHLRENFEALREHMSPHWRRVLGEGRPVDLFGALRVAVGDQPVKSLSLARWADDGGRV